MHSLTLTDALKRNGVKKEDAEERLDKILESLSGLPLEVILMFFITSIDNVTQHFDEDRKDWFLSNISININEMLTNREKRSVN